MASTKYPRKLSQASESGILPEQVVVWKMKVPEKKPLVRREAPEEIKAKVRRSVSTTRGKKIFDKYKQR